MAGLSIGSPIPNWTPMSRSCTIISASRTKSRQGTNREDTSMKRILSLTALAILLACGTASAQQINVKVGVLTDMSSLYADATGIGSVIAARMAAADFMKEHPNVKVEV